MQPERNGRGETDRLYAVVEAITPEIAQEYLDKNSENRALKRAYVNKLAAAILRGEWVFNGETIKFNAAGRLIDGQHRLAAIVAARTTVEMLVVRNATDEAQDTVDLGTRRTLSDALRIRREPNNAVVAAGIGWLYRLQRANGRNTVTSGDYPSVKQGLAILAANPGLRDSKTVSHTLYTALRLPQGLGMAFHYFFRSIDEQDAEMFFEQLIGGAGLDEDDPVLVLRRKLEHMMVEKPKPPQTYVAAVIIKGWNAYREGRNVSRLFWSPGGSRKEPFPLPR